MKIGFCSNMNANDSNGIGQETFTIFRDAGFDYVELPLAQVMQLNDKDFTGLLKCIEIFEGGCYACNNFFPSHIKLTGPTVDYFKIEQYVEEATDRAKRMGAKLIVLGSAESKNIPFGFSKEEAELQLKKCLSLIGKSLQKSNILIALEPLNRIESNIINTIDEAYTIVNELELDNVGVLCDFFHLSVEKESLEVLNLVREKLYHVHLADLLGRSFPLTDREELKQLIRIFAKIEYNGNVSIEAYSKKLACDSVDTLKILRNIISNI